MSCSFPSKASLGDRERVGGPIADRAQLIAVRHRALSPL
jgi:hypothetical protein